MKNTENMIRRIVAVLLTLVLFFSSSAQTFIPSSAAYAEGETETAIRPEGDYAGVSTPTDLRDPIPPEEPVPDNPSAEPAAGAPEEAPAADTEEAPADDTQEELPAAGAEEETSAAAMPVMPEGVMEPVRPVVAEQPAEPETDPAAGLFVLPTETEDAPEETDQPRLECKTKR